MVADPAVETRHIFWIIHCLDCGNFFHPIQFSHTEVRYYLL